MLVFSCLVQMQDCAFARFPVCVILHFTHKSSSNSLIFNKNKSVTDFFAYLLTAGVLFPLEWFCERPLKRLSRQCGVS